MNLSSARRGGLSRKPLVRQNAHELAILGPFLFEFHLAFGLGEKRVVTTNADVGSRMKMRSTLAHENVAGNDLLSAIHLDAESLRF